MSAVLSFVRRGSHAALEKPTKYPLRRVEPLLRKYFKVFQINLDRMQQHKVNIQKVFVTIFFVIQSVELQRFCFILDLIFCGS